MGYHIFHKATSATPGRLAQRVATGGTLLVEFAERDAPVCRLEEPVLDRVLRHFADRLSVVQADVESSAEDAAAFAITAVPTFLLFVAGGEKLRLVGYQSFDDLTRAIDEVLPAPDEPVDQR